jgi:hypothetical protein
LPALSAAAGVALLLLGLQGWAFQRHVAPRLAAAEANLARLRQEAPTNELMNDALSALGDCWRLAADDGRKRKLVALRDTVMRRFAEDPAMAVAELDRAAAELRVETKVEQSALEFLRARTARLKAAYSDGYGELLTLYSDVPWYLQPGAALFQTVGPTKQRLAFNHAQYLMLTGNREQAGKALDELRRSARSREFSSRVLFAQARLSYDAYRTEANVQYYDDALQYVRQSLHDDPDYALPKLFLEFLLAVDQAAVDVDMSPVEAQGSGEAEGERGDISDGSREF